MYLHSVNMMHSKRKYTFNTEPLKWTFFSLTHFQQLSHDTVWNQHRKLQCVHDFYIKKEFLSAGRAVVEWC